ncbi:MAG: (2Fe-2S)-binding protein [Gammaproteobacteria bacterium]|nr:(2Fe-2S)-binding protein [Gammaproteobacteria bacterium]
MYVCLCKGITDNQIKDAVYGGASNLRAVRKQLGVTTQCGKCGIYTQQLIAETLSAATVGGQESQFYAAG